MILLKALSLTLIQFIEFVSAATLLICLVLRSGQLVLQVFDRLPHISLSSLHFALIDLRLFRSLLFLDAFSLVHLSNELFLLEGKLLSFKLNHLKLLFVLTTQLSELQFPLPELVRLQLELLVDGHDLLELTLLARQISHQVAILTDQLSVLPFYLVQSDPLILLALTHFSQVGIKCLKTVTLFALKLFRQLLVELVLLLE